jgi:CheY-like chemotaxis protein
MLRLVTTNNVEVFRHLGSPSFQRLGIEQLVASSHDEALAAVREHGPTLAIVDAELAGGSGFDLCRAIKDDPALRATHVIILLDSVITRGDFERIERSGCDDVLALPLPSDDFYHHIAQVAGLPFRRNRRVGVALDVILPEVGDTIRGTVSNVSAAGIGVQVPAPLSAEQSLLVRLRHDGQTYPDTRATVAWTKPAEVPSEDAPDGAVEVQAGLRFGDDLPMKTRLLLEQLALYDVSPAPADSPMEGGVTVSLQGDFTEITDFSTLATRLESETKIDFNAAAVRYISSAGVRSWCQFLLGLEGKQYSFRHCSMAFASQAAMVPMVVGTGKVLSVEAPYLCETCDREELRLLETRALLHDNDHIIPPQLTCRVCNGELEFDDVPDRYFAFLRR